MNLSNTLKGKNTSILFNIILWGTMWCIFETTVGYLLHLLPISIGWIVWYPAACFFMANIYRITQNGWAVLITAGFCAAFKFINIMLPGPIDRVVNPAVSILFEAVMMIVAILFYNRRKYHKAGKALTVIAMNSGWRLLFMFYLCCVPQWIRDQSVISSMSQFVSFFVIENLITSVIIIAGVFLSAKIHPVKVLEHRVSAACSRFPGRTAVLLKYGIIVFLLGANIVLKLIL